MSRVCRSRKAEVTRTQKTVPVQDVESD